MDKEREHNAAFTAGVLTHHLFEKLVHKGVMRAHDIITEEALKFIEEHEEVEEEGEWSEYCDSKGYSDWEEYLVATVEQKLKL